MVLRRALKLSERYKLGTTGPHRSKPALKLGRAARACGGGGLTVPRLYPMVADLPSQTLRPAVPPMIFGEIGSYAQTNQDGACY